MEPIPFEEAYEVLEDHEDDTGLQLVETLLEIASTTHRDTGLGLRSVHAKSHALLRGEMHVPAHPLPLAQGLFAKPATFPVILRMSTSPGDLLDDRVSTPRGVALKVIGTEGARLPGSEAQHTQDFLLIDGPAFLAPTAQKFLGSLKLLGATTDRVPRLKRAFSAILRGTEKLVEAAGSESPALKGLGGHPETNPLGETYFSQVPFLYGLNMVKWQLAPLSPNLVALKDAPVDLAGRPDGLREAVSQHFETQGGEWTLSAQFCTDLQAMPIEDASVVWPEAMSPFLPLARIVIPAQSAWSEAQSIEIDDGMAFSPWQGLAAHRPLGSINRARRGAYPASAAARSARGRCPVHEPALPPADQPGHG